MSRRLPDRTSNPSQGGWPQIPQNYESYDEDGEVQEEGVEEDEDLDFENEYFDNESMRELMGLPPLDPQNTAPQATLAPRGQPQNYATGPSPGDYAPQDSEQYAYDPLLDPALYLPGEEPTMTNQYFDPTPATAPIPNIYDQNPFSPNPYDQNMPPPPPPGAASIPNLTQAGRPNPFPPSINHPYIPQLPVPIIPLTPTAIPVPTATRGGLNASATPRADRRLLNPNLRMWWNQTAQRRTNPSSDKCYQCVAGRLSGGCSLARTSYPCKRCKDLGKANECTNGMPSREWEHSFLRAIGVDVPELRGRKAMQEGEVRLENLIRQKKNQAASSTNPSPAPGGDDGNIGDGGYPMTSLPGGGTGPSGSQDPFSSIDDDDNNDVTVVATVPRGGRRGRGSRGGRTGIGRAGFRAPNPFLPTPAPVAAGPDKTVKRKRGRPRGSFNKKGLKSRPTNRPSATAGVPYAPPRPAQRDEPEGQDQYPIPDQYPATRPQAPVLNRDTGIFETISPNPCDFCQEFQLTCSPEKPCSACNDARVLCKNSVTGEEWPLREVFRDDAPTGLPYSPFALSAPGFFGSAGLPRATPGFLPPSEGSYLPVPDPWRENDLGDNNYDDPIDFAADSRAEVNNGSVMQNVDIDQYNTELNTYAAEPQQNSNLNAGQAYVMTPPMPGIGVDEYEDYVDKTIAELLTASQSWAAIEPRPIRPANIHPDLFALFGDDDEDAMSVEDLARKRDRDRLQAYQVYRAGRPRSQAPPPPFLGSPFDPYRGNQATSRPSSLGFVLRSPFDRLSGNQAPPPPSSRARVLRSPFDPYPGTPYGSRTSSTGNRASQPIRFGAPLPPFQPRIPPPVIQQAVINLPGYANWNWDGTGIHNGPDAWPFKSINPNRTVGGFALGDMLLEACMEQPRSVAFPNLYDDEDEDQENNPNPDPGATCGQAPVKVCECVIASKAQHPANPFNTCVTCHQKRYSLPQYNMEYLELRKKFLCRPCASIALGQNGQNVTVGPDCVCQITMSNVWLCHQHRDVVERDFVAGLATAEAALIGLGAEGMCVACKLNREDGSSGVFSCKYRGLNRERIESNCENRHRISFSASGRKEERIGTKKDIVYILVPSQPQYPSRMSGPGDRKGKGRARTVDGYAYYDEDGVDITDLYANLPPAERAQVARARANDGVDTLARPGSGEEPFRGRTRGSSGSGSAIRGEPGAGPMPGRPGVDPGPGPGEDTEMTGTDVPYATGSMYPSPRAPDPQPQSYLPNRATPQPSVPFPGFHAANMNDRPPGYIDPNARPPPPTSFLPTPTPAGFPAPRQPLIPLVTPRVGGKGKGHECRNGLPTTTWENDEIKRMKAVARGESGERVPSGGRGPGRPGRDDRPQRPRSASPEIGRGTSGGFGRPGLPATGRDDVTTYPHGPGPPPISNLADVGMSAQGQGTSGGTGGGIPSILPTRQRPLPSSRREERRERTPRSRTRSPGRDRQPRDDDSNDDDEEDYDDNGGEGSSRNPPPIPTRSKTSKEPSQKRNRKRVYATKESAKARVPIESKVTDEEYFRRFGKPKKCHDCTNMKILCTGGKPCDQCTRVGRECVNWNCEPYTAAPPLGEHPSVQNSNVLLNPVTGNGVFTAAAAGAVTSTASMRPPPSGPLVRRPPSRAQRPAQDRARRQAQAANQVGDPLDIFQNRTNPFHHLRRDVEELGFGVPEANRGRLAAPIPPDWHNERERRMFDAQYPYRYLDPNADLRRGYGFTGTAESMNRPVWEEHAAARNWYIPPSYIGQEPAPDPSLVRPDPEPYMVDLQNPNPLPVFGQNVQAVDDILNARIPAPGANSQVPWIATWNYDQGRTRNRGLNAHTETRGPLGWPYPMIDSLAPDHSHVNAIFYSDPVPCCENENQFNTGQNPKLCRVEPALKCGVLGRYDCEHEENPWHTCHICRNKQANFWHPAQEETLRRQKLYLCKDCAYLVRIESRSWERECLCYASKTCANVCHMHREGLENSASEPLLISEDFLIREGILARDSDKCIMCNVQDADAESNIWSCKLCREWVSETSRPLVDDLIANGG
ncbi:hypothetical protein VTL71DRAFT_13259 [Oculimacula yallundae]|uniref:Zn(2)-C6 fungal-type domain-containing protein n=1 Tax=Oculimacula yallundae TaxID=86028 RepID=A0ABR4CJU1_9HELO